jgi:hypothetical protein
VIPRELESSGLTVAFQLRLAASERLAEAVLFQLIEPALPFHPSVWMLAVVASCEKNGWDSPMACL